MPVIYFLFLINFILGASSTPCAPRNYGKGSVVCVCNLTYCDEFDSFKTSPGSIIRFESGLSGKRFEKSTLKFQPLKQNDSSTSNQTKTIIINKNVTYQKIIGFGGSFTDSAGISILKLPDTMAKRIIRDYFGPKGLEYTMARVPMGGSDFSIRKYTYDDGPVDFNLTNFKLQNEDFVYKIPLMKYAKTVTKSNIKLFASPWSAPVWMKTNKDLAGNGTMRGTPGDLYHKSWANYFIKFLNAYKTNGLHMWGLTTLNEPNNGFLSKFPFNCMGFSAKSMRDFIKLDLGPALHKSGYSKVKLMTMDDQRYHITNWTNTILKDKDASRYVSGIAVHWYFDNSIPATLLDNAHNDFPDYFILSTEACEGSLDFEKVSLGNWIRAENYAYDIIIDLQHYISGWVDWNLALNEQGGPNWVENYVDSPIIVNATAKEYYKQPMYYALGHFTKFLPPDSLRVQHVELGQHNVHSVVFSTPKKETVLIVLNKEEQDVPLIIKDLKNNKLLKTKIPAKSIQTYIY